MPPPRPPLEPPPPPLLPPLRRKPPPSCPPLCSTMLVGWRRRSGASTYAITDRGSQPEAGRHDRDRSIDRTRGGRIATDAPRMRRKRAELEEDVDPRLCDAQPARYNRAQPPGKAESQLVRGIRAGVRGGGQAHAGEGWHSRARTMRKKCAARSARGGCRSSGAMRSNEVDDLTCRSHISPGLRAPAHKRIDAARGIHAVIGTDLACIIIWNDRRVPAREIWAGMRKCCAGDA
jgi:hypothetical protein